MAYMTWTELAAQLEDELDLEEGILVSDAEKIRLVNRLIRQCHRETIRINKRFYKTHDFVSLVQGTSEYAMPTNIYNARFTRIQYDDGSCAYRVPPIKDEKIASVDTQDDYSYDLENAGTANGLRFVLYPPSRVTSNTALKRIYTRAPEAVTSGASLIDVIDDGIDFIMKNMRVPIAEKRQHPMLAQWINERAEALQDFRESLDPMNDDGANEVEGDFSHYEEMT